MNKVLKYMFVFFSILVLVNTVNVYAYDQNKTVTLVKNDTTVKRKIESTETKKEESKNPYADIKEENKEQNKEENKEESKEENKEESKEESKEENKEENKNTDSKFEVSCLLQDKDNKENIDGAVLIVKDETGKEVARWTTTKEAYKLKLNSGKYTLEEATAPTGYMLQNEKIEFLVNSDKTGDSEVTMFNTKTVNVPITDANVSLYTIGLGIVGLFIGVYKLRKSFI